MGVGIYWSTLERDALGAGFGVRSDLNREDEGEGDDVVAELRSAIAAIGGDPRPHRTARVPFNRSMIVVGEGADYTVGLMGWQHDYVIEVGGSEQVHDWLCDPSWHEKSIRDSSGLSPTRFARDAIEFHTRLSRYLSLTIMQAGLACYVLSGGWIPSPITKPGDRMLEVERKRLQGWLKRRRRGYGAALERQAA